MKFALKLYDSKCFIFGDKMSKKKKNKKYKNEKDKSKKSKKKKNKNKKDKNKRKYLKFYKVLVPFGSGLIAIIGIFIALKEKYREEAILEPRFSLERNINEDGSLTWKIYNSGGEISNAIIYPTMHITFFYENRKTNEDIDITLEVPDYFVENNFGYSTLDGAFYIIDEKENELNEFIEKYTSVTYSEEFEYLDTIISPYFILNYEDYKKIEKIVFIYFPILVLFLMIWIMKYLEKSFYFWKKFLKYQFLI